jgi:hypothetical protein
MFLASSAVAEIYQWKDKNGKKRQALCDHWRSRIEIYKQAGPIAIMSPQGERQYQHDG